MFIDVCTHGITTIIRYGTFPSPQKVPHAPSRQFSLPCAQPPAAAALFSVAVICFFQNVIGIIWHVVLCVWLLSLSICV